jgi:hypothetical protein
MGLKAQRLQTPGLIRGWLDLFLTLLTQKDCTEVLPPALLGDHPRAQFPWWAMPHVLRVTARKFGNPLRQVVLMKADDNLWLTPLLP